MNKVTSSKLQVTRWILVFSLFSFVCSILAFPSYAAEDFKFKDADIRVVLQAISQKAVTRSGIDGEIEKRVNIIVSPKVKGLISVSLEDVDWLTALEGILKAYGYGHEWIEDDLILVATLEDLAETREKNSVAAQQEPLDTVTYVLKYLDAYDVKKLIEPQLTPRGRITILEVEPQKGWRARGGYTAGETETVSEKAEREEGARPRTRVMVITDTKSNLRNLIESVKKVDIMPRQVLIKAKIMEVNRDTLKDIGFDFGTGPTGATGDAAAMLPLDASDKRRIGGWSLSNEVTPSVFDPKTADIAGLEPYTTGLALAFRKLTGAQFEAVFHALEEDVNSNILSAPHILTLDGQEAYIMVGRKQPIIKSTVAVNEGVVTVTRTLGYYQKLGIELNVIPHISGEDFINMAIYPSVTTSTENVEAISSAGGFPVTDYFPIIQIRETQTQIMMKDGETIVIGGLLKDIHSEGVIKVPILGDIPLLGFLFQRRTTDIYKVDLLIFITANIIRPGQDLPQKFVDTKQVITSFEKQEEKKK